MWRNDNQERKRGLVGWKREQARSRSWIYCTQRLHAWARYLNVSQYHVESSRLDRLATPRKLISLSSKCMHQPLIGPMTEVDVLNSQLENGVRKLPRKDITIIHGDFNAMIGGDAHTDWPETAWQTLEWGPTNERPTAIGFCKDEQDGHCQHAQLST